MEGIPQFPARASTTNPDLDEQKRNQALPEELKVAPSTPVELDLKQQPLQHQPYRFVGPLKNNVEITHAEAHEELNLDKRMGPSPVAPMQIMHKAKKKYVVGKVSGLEEVKLRQLNAILNKLTPRNFEKLFKKVKEVNIDNVVTLSGFVSRIFHRALMEPTFCEIYANFCSRLASNLPDFSEDNERITFKRLLLNKCQKEFERGEREEAEAGKTEEEGGIDQTKEEREERRICARRRMLGNITFFGELYKKRMLTERIMHECIKKLIGDFHNPDEENIEALCKLMSTIGEVIDHPKAKQHMDAYFEIMQKLSTSQKLSFRVRFLLRDSMDLRTNKWQQNVK
ncbi:eukaryotic translation initiation factor 4G-like [Phragmites australis]|uniref:eukaryotic translation initiation factor 4G-like n=1 Tax=Phragmites australis TaxID=29695 RepID=UPI002D780A2A|nr:eukaryotic translation initiation factor 4G-like [Phragmites australis]